MVEPAEGHLCCGSAGTYNIVQPEIAGRLRERKLGNISATAPDLIAAGNIGCITQLSGGGCPVSTRCELLDWMAGGPRPAHLPEMPLPKAESPKVESPKAESPEMQVPQTQATP